MKMGYSAYHEDDEPDWQYRIDKLTKSIEDLRVWNKELETQNKRIEQQNKHLTELLKREGSQYKTLEKYCKAKIKVLEDQCSNLTSICFNHEVQFGMGIIKLGDQVKAFGIEMDRIEQQFKDHLNAPTEAELDDLARSGGI